MPLTLDSGQPRSHAEEVALFRHAIIGDSYAPCKAQLLEQWQLCDLFHTRVVTAGGAIQTELLESNQRRNG